MNLRVDLIQDSERRSASPVSIAFLIRLVNVIIEGPQSQDSDA